MEIFVEAKHGESAEICKKARKTEGTQSVQGTYQSKIQGQWRGLKAYSIGVLSAARGVLTPYGG